MALHFVMYRRWAGPVVLIVLGACANYQALSASFLSDDFTFLAGIGEGVRDFVLSEVRSGRFLRPVTMLFLALDCRLWGLAPVGYHLTNLLLHCVNAVLLLSIGRRLAAEPDGPRSNGAFSLAGAILFVALPTHSESLAWISGRSDLLSTCFCLLSLLFYLSSRRTKRVLHAAASLSFFASALLSKESAIALPLVVLGFEVVKASSENRPFWGWKPSGTLVLQGVTATVYLAVRAWLLGSLVGGYGTSVHTRIDLWNLPTDIVYRCARSFVPPSLVTSVSRIVALFLCIVVLLTVGVIVVRHRTRSPISRLWVPLAAAWLATLLPAINLAVSDKDTQGERFLYWPSAFACLLVASALGYVLRQRAFRIAVVLISLAFVLASWKANSTWVAAGRIADGILESIREMPPARKLVIINCPDNINGAYVFRNGLPDAIKLTRERRSFEEVMVLSTQELRSIDDAIAVESKFGETELRSGLDAPAFDWVPSVRERNGVVLESSEVLLIQEHGCKIRWRRRKGDETLAYYSLGRMLELPRVLRPAMPPMSSLDDKNRGAL